MGDQILSRYLNHAVSILQCQQHVTTVIMPSQILGGEEMDKKDSMDKKAASRIQSRADRTGEDKDFARRAQSAAEKNAAKDRK
jgi:hypothetical protein